MTEKLSEEEKEEIFNLLDEGKSVRDIAEELDRNKNTISSYRQEWKEEKEIEDKVMRSEFEVKDFERELNKIPKVGKKKIQYAMDLVSLDKDIIYNPDAIYRLLTNEIGIKAHIVDTFVTGLMKKYDLDRQRGGNYDPQYRYSRGRRPEEYDEGRHYDPRSGYDEYNGDRQRDHNQRQQQQPQQQTLEDKKESMVMIEVPMLDNEGDPKRDKDGEIIYIKKTVPESKAEEYGLVEKKSESDDFFDRLVKLQKVGILPKVDNQPKQDDNKGALEQKVDMLMAQIRQMQTQNTQQPEQQKEEPMSAEEVRQLITQDRQELLRNMEMQKKDQEYEDIKQRMERLLEQKETSELSKMPDDVRKAKVDMEQQETTAKTILEGLDKVGNRMESVTERLMTFGEGKQQEEAGNREVKLYRTLINNLMAQGYSKQDAIRSARYLLYGQTPQVKDERGETKKQSEDQLLENLKKRAQEGDV